MSQTNVVHLLRQLISVQQEYTQAEKEWNTEMRGSIENFSKRAKLEQQMIMWSDLLAGTTSAFLTAAEGFLGVHFDNENVKDAIDAVLAKIEELVPA